MLLSVGAATALCLVTIGISLAQDDQGLIAFASIWWLIAASVGLLMGRGETPLANIQQLLSRSRTEPIFPKVEPASVMLDRQWPVFAMVAAAVLLGLLMPPAPAAAAGSAILWALALRKQPGAVLAIEDRDGVRFYVVRTNPFAKIKLVRVIGYGGLP